MFCRAITKLGFSKWRRQGGGALYSTSIATTKYLLVPWQIAAKECMSSLQVTISLSLTQLSYLEVSFARSMLVYSSFLSNRHTPPAYVRPELAFHFFIITVTWFEVPDHVSLTGRDYQLQIKRNAESHVWCSDPRLSTRREPAFRIKLLL